MRYQQLSGQTPAIYRPIPSEEEIMISNPKQDAILTYLSKIHHNSFVEFIKDILTLVDRHTLIDITDGPGDEKQDILTVTPDGERCLIQCKHTFDYHSKYTGNDIDTLSVACIRKNCTMGLFITNGEITTQAKRYINDCEYQKGWPKEVKPLIIDYWNYYRIWEKIRINTNILNKWFGGLGQTHGLRNFKFEFSVHRMPYDPSSDENILDNILKTLLNSSIIIKSDRELFYEGNINDEIKFSLNRDIHLMNNLDIRYIPPENIYDTTKRILDSICVNVNVNSNNLFDPNSIRKKILLYLLEQTLKALPSGYWWHIISGRSTSFIFVHDVLEPKLIALDDAETFIKVNDANIQTELSYCEIHEDEFKFCKGGKAKGMFQHRKLGTYLISYFIQKSSYLDDFNWEEIQETQRRFLINYVFKMTKIERPDEADLIINYLPGEWSSFKRDDDHLFWCYPVDWNKRNIVHYEKKIQILGFQIFDVSDDEKSKIIENIRMIVPECVVHDSLKNLTFPINLKERIFWFCKSFPVKEEVTFDIIKSLSQYKFFYEKKWGFLNKFIPNRDGTFDIGQFLFEPSKIRGFKMIDINYWSNPISVIMRLKEGKTDSGDNLANEGVTEFEKVFTDIQTIFYDGKVF